MMSWISILCLCFFFISIITLFKKGTDVFSPARLFVIIWSLAIGLADLKLSRYQIVWTSYSWTMLGISLFSMLTGMFVVYVINLDKPLMKIGTIRESLNNYPLDSKKLFRYTNFLFVAYVISYIISWVVIGYIPIFTAKPDLARTTWGIFGFGLFIQSIPALLYLIILYFLLAKKQKAKKVILAFIFFISFVTYLLLLQRYYIVFALLVSTVFMYYGSKKLKTKNVLILSVMISLVLYGISSIRLSRYALNFIFYISQMKFSSKYAFLTEPYMYIVMNLENFANAVNKLGEHTYGIFTFDSIFALTGLKHTLNEYLCLPEYPYLLTNTYNTFTMFFIYYWDFGVIGLGIVPFLIGAFFSTSYFSMRRNPNLSSISLYAISVAVIVFSFFVPIVSFLHFLFNLILIFFITRASQSIK